METAISVRPRPIRSAADHRAALRRIDALMGSPAGTPEADELEVLAVLAEDWERRHHPLERAAPHEVLAQLMEANGLTQAEMSELGRQSHVSEILAGKRPIPRRAQPLLAARFGVPVSVFI